ncbi:RNA binding protein Rnp24, putative [Paecilomyces variotii No. 5]|uniref:RNA binding protein Rnp24, putative n=1 Tax=Byssochlamys spectabilis (strain No. 5 / NBRC 109023) TaxID=1356009 RepID=V5FRC4_BYSSN|nr:RNA binding protein Rnp24, putative [Paecilomyces variotii No. 5]
MAGLGEGKEKKRKLQDVPELEIDVSAPEPPSKKALRKAKKKGTTVDDKLATDPTSEHSEGPQKAADQDSSKRSSYGVWIGNLAFSVTKDDLRKFLISNCTFPDSTITRLHLPNGPEKYGKPQNRGFAYVDFSNQKAVKEAIALSEQLLTGRPVLIKDSHDFKGRPEKHQAPEGSTGDSGKLPSRRIFVGNLGFDATKEILEEHFGKCGTVTNVHLATFEDSGKCKGYGWVEFEDIEAATAAVRGSVNIPEEDEEDLEEDDAEDSGARAKKSHKPKFRKVWVNRLLGRHLRTEFAEDSATRYKKRFGKEGKNRDGAVEQYGEVAAARDTDTQHGHKKRFTKSKGDSHDNSRYSKETVQRLSGAIVEAQGKKTTFD